MPGGDIAKGHCWTDGDPGAGVGATHHARRIVADGIEAFEGNPVAIDHLRMGVGGNAGKGAKSAGNDANRIETAAAQAGAMHGSGNWSAAPLKR